MILSYGIDKAVPYFLIGSALSIVVSSLMYMLGSSLKMDELNAKAKEILINLLFATFILVVSLSLYHLISSILSIALGLGPGGDLIKTAEIANSDFKTTIGLIFIKYYIFDLIIGILSTFEMSVNKTIVDIGVAGVSFLTSETGVSLGVLLNELKELAIDALARPTISFSVFSGLAPFVNMLSMVADPSAIAYLFSLSKQVLLDFVSNFMWIFFAIGLILRSFPFTQKTGSNLIALSIVLYFVWPSSIILSHYMVYSAYKVTTFYYTPTSLDILSDKGEVMSREAIQEELSKNEEFIDSLNKENEELKKPPSGLGAVWYYLTHTIKSGWSFFKNDVVGRIVPKNFIDFFMFIAGLGFGAFQFLPMLYDFVFYFILTDGQYLALFFITSTIEFLIVVTAFSSISPAIGGEGNIFGVSKVSRFI